jgi:small subunit ribosomal protein S1
VNKEEEKISLSLKQTKEDPWETLDEKYPVGSKVVGKVRNLTNFGAFIELEEGIDGLVHISDMSWTRRVRHPNEIVHKGDDVEVIVLGIDKNNHRISLGIKQLKENPWDDLEAKYVVGHETEGTITKLLEQGVVVELPDDVEGFVPISHLATDNIDNPSDIFSEGDVLPLKVIDFDKHNRRIVLSVKAYFEDKEARELEKYKEKYSEKVPTKLGEVVDEETGKKLSKKSEKAPEKKAKKKAEKKEKAPAEKTPEKPKEEKVEAEEKPEAEKKSDAEETEEPKKQESVEAEETPEKKESEEETEKESEEKEETPESEEEKPEESEQTEENAESESEKSNEAESSEEAETEADTSEKEEDKEE